MELSSGGLRCLTAACGSELSAVASREAVQASPSPVHLDFYVQHPAHLRTESYTRLLAHKLEYLHTRCPVHLQLGTPSSDIPTLTIPGDSTPPDLRP